MKKLHLILLREAIMQISKIRINLLLAIFMVTIFVQGCATKVPVTKIRIEKVPEITLNTQDSGPLVQKGLRVSIKPIFSKNIEMFPQFTGKVHYSYPKKMDWTYVGYKTGVVQYVKETGEIDKLPLFPLPAFEVLIANNTDHVIKFTNATLVMEDSNGNIFDVLSKQDLPSYLQQAIRVNLDKNNIPKDARVENKDELYADQRSVKILDHNFKILPRRTSKGYLVYNYGRYTHNDFWEFVLGQTQFNVQLFELPIKVDKAANVLETTSFSLFFDIKIHEKEVKYTTLEYR